jgi:hypothetical protein
VLPSHQRPLELAGAELNLPSIVSITSPPEPKGDVQRGRRVWPNAAAGAPRRVDPPSAPPDDAHVLLQSFPVTCAARRSTAAARSRKKSLVVPRHLPHRTLRHHHHGLEKGQNQGIPVTCGAGRSAAATERSAAGKSETGGEFLTHKTTCASEMLEKTTCRKICQKRPLPTRGTCRLGRCRQVHAATAKAGMWLGWWLTLPRHPASIAKAGMWLFF